MFYTREVICHGLHTITFKPLTEADIGLLTAWLEKPHVKEWWNDDLSHEQIWDKYRSRIGDPNTVSFIFYLDKKPLGFIQYYYASRVGHGWWPDAVAGTVGIDQYIGEEDYINKGYGTVIIRSFIEKLLAESHIKKIIVDVDPNNLRAIRCYEKVGFKRDKIIQTPDGLALLMMLSKKI